MSTAYNEKRQAKRFTSNAQVNVSYNQGLQSGQCINESETGVLIALKDAITVDSHVEISQKDGGDNHKGQVVRLIEDDNEFLIAVKY